MPDFGRLARLHLERTLVVAESIGDDEWAKQARNELKRHQADTKADKPTARQTRKPAARPVTDTKEAGYDGDNVPA